MQLYNSNIVGSNAYFYKHHRNLELLIDAEGAPTAWYTMTAADNYWHDLHAMLKSKESSDSYDDMDEKQKLNFRITIIKTNPHLVDEYFYTRVKIFFTIYLKVNQLDGSYNWFRIEFQARGTAHIHGCMRLKSDPGISQLSELVRDGRIAERELTRRLIGCVSAYNSYVEVTRKEDNFLTNEVLKQALGEEEFKRVLSDDEITTYKQDIQTGIDAEKKICAYNDFLFTSKLTGSADDMRSAVRDPNTVFKQNGDNVHPSGIAHNDFVSMNDEQKLLHREKLQKAVQRHKCGKYFLRDENCRFSFPLPEVKETHIQIEECVVKREKTNC